MKTLATAVAIAIVLSVSAAAKTVLDNPQRVAPHDAAHRVESIPNLYIDAWTEGYPPDQTNQLSVIESMGNRPHGRR
ncbi:MAG: hypothetical protein JOZ94_28540 [Xanthobacteraceae bacterium]|nr:hypothetical protein [Xanthobacteraceae bacterium]MBV9239805.1 hypothetical protein [Xanthobacteraceae bacterium]MBV9632202.1 hypothetical protein [Xanthobacteraceae bacterium]